VRCVCCCCCVATPSIAHTTNQTAKKLRRTLEHPNCHLPPASFSLPSQDCEFTYLSVQVLNVLGRDGPHANDPTRYIRYVYNRVILENATVRAAAVAALAKFGVHCEALRDRVIVLLRRCLFDNDDEVRDRAMLSLSLLESGTAENHELVTEGLPVSFAAIEKALEKHTSEGASGAFLLQNVQELAKHEVEDAPKKVGGMGALSAAASAGAPAASTKKEPPAHTILHGVPGLSDLGKCFKSSPAMPITEQETEYMVVCTKHVFAAHVVFQFNVNNTIENTCLEQCQMEMEAQEQGFAESCNVPCTQPLLYDSPANTFVCFSLEEAQATGTFSCTLKFIVKDVDEATGEPDEEGYEDEYQVDDIDLTAADFIRPTATPDFRNSWQTMAEPFEVREQMGLEATNLQDAVTGVVTKLGLAPCEKTQFVPDGADGSHDLLMSGMGMSGAPVLVRAALKSAPGKSCMMRMMVRSPDGELAAAVAGLIQR
jgi:coatomer subunit gamma